MLTGRDACIAATLPITFCDLLLQLVEVRRRRHSSGFDCKPRELLRGVPVNGNLQINREFMSAGLTPTTEQVDRTESSRRPSPCSLWLSCAPMPDDACPPGRSMLLHTGTIGRP